MSDSIDWAKHYNYPQPVVDPFCLNEEAVMVDLKIGCKVRVKSMTGTYDAVLWSLGAQTALVQAEGSAVATWVSRDDLEPVG